MNLLTLLLTAGGLFSCFSLNANVVWPMLLYKSSLYATPIGLLIILLGFLAEWWVMYRFLQLSGKQSYLITLEMNLASAILGSMLILLLDFFVLADTLWTRFNVGTRSTFSLADLTYSIAASVIINCFIEYFVARAGLKNISPSHPNLLKAIVTANALSGVLTLLILFILGTLASHF